MRKSYFIILFIVLGVAFLIIYANLGGFKDIQVEKKELSEIRLKGKYFRGTPLDPELEKTFQEIQAESKNQSENSFYTIYILEPAGKTDTLHVFVGLEDLNLNYPKNWDSLNFTKGVYLTASIESHPLVMPSPESVKEAIISFALQEELPKPLLFIEKIIAKNKVQVIAPIY